MRQRPRQMDPNVVEHALIIISEQPHCPAASGLTHTCNFLDFALLRTR